MATVSTLEIARVADRMNSSQAPSMLTVKTSTSSSKLQQQQAQNVNPNSTTDSNVVHLATTQSNNSKLPRLFSRSWINLENCILPEDKLNNPPSLSDGMSLDLEREFRYLGSELIQTASILLQLPQVAAATGQILFQRFYYSKSFVRYNFENTAMACVNLASKIEEAPRRIRDVINVFHHMKQLNRLRSLPARKKLSPMLVDAKYVAVKNEVIKSERRVLKELGFCVHVKHPHKLIVSYLRALNAENETQLIQKSWNFMNDSLRTDVFLRFSPETIACACIYLAARVLDYPLPTTNETKWWQLFDVDETSILHVCRILWRMYARKSKPCFEKLDDQANKLKVRLQSFTSWSKNVQNTPNPHAGGGAGLTSGKFSPPSQSRQTSPNGVEVSSSSNKKVVDNLNGEISSSNAAAAKKIDRKRLSRKSDSHNRHSRKRRRRGSGSAESVHSTDHNKNNTLSPTPLNDDQQQQQKSSHLPKRYSRQGDFYRDDRKKEQVSDSLIKRRRTSKSSPSPSPHRKQRKLNKRRSRSSSRLRRDQEKREREVRSAMGKEKDRKSTASRYRR